MAPSIWIYPEIVGVCLSLRVWWQQLNTGCSGPMLLKQTYIHFLGNELFIFLLSCTLFFPQK